MRKFQSNDYKRPARKNNNQDGMKKSGYQTKRKPFIKKENKPTITIEDVKNRIIACLCKELDTDKYYYRYELNEKKKEHGIIGISFKASLKEDKKKERYIHIYIIQDMSKKISITITDGSLSSATVLFFNNSVNSVEKAEKFIPSIIISLQKKVLQM